MRMMSDIEDIATKLPGLDCGSCGAPTCMAFAEDIVKNETHADECTVILKRLLREQGIGHDQVLASLEKLSAMKKPEKDGKDGNDG